MTVTTTITVTMIVTVTVTVIMTAPRQQSYLTHAYVHKQVQRYIQNAYHSFSKDTVVWLSESCLMIPKHSATNLFIHIYTYMYMYIVYCLQSQITMTSSTCAALTVSARSSRCFSMPRSISRSRSVASSAFFRLPSRSRSHANRYAQGISFSETWYRLLSKH
jgi:hypothetical protein